MKKIISLFALLVMTIIAKADVTVGLTQDYSVDTNTEEGAKTWTTTTIADDNIAITQQIGSQILNYEHTTTGKGAAYIDGTGHGKGLHCWRVGDPGTSYDNQYVGYDVSIASGYNFNITTINARALYISTGLTWKVQILSSTDELLYESAEMTMAKTGTSPSIDLEVSTLDEDTKAKLEGLSGSFKVRLWAKGGKTKYFGIDKLQITGALVEDTRPTYSVTASVAEGQDAMGSVAGGGDIAEGETAILTATANTGYAFVNWTLNDVEASTDATLVITNVSADAAYVANFKQVYQVAWHGDYRGTYGKAGTGYSLDNGVNERWADKDDKFIIPLYMHKYYYRPGYRFTKWQIVGDESTNRYNSGDEITVTDGTISSNKVTVKPGFTATTATLDNSQAPTTVTWSLAKSDMVFVDWQSSDKYEYYTVSATVNGEEIAVPMRVSKGKVANYTRTDDMAQTNQNTEFTIPAVKGMVVTIANAYTAFTATTIAGSTEYEKSDNDKTITYTYDGEDDEIVIVIGETGQYLKSIQVVYPANPTTITLNASGYATYSSAYDFTFSGAQAYKMVLNENSLAGTEVTGKIKAGEGVLFKGDANAEVTINSTTGAEALADNDLKGTTPATGNAPTPNYTDYKYFVLSGSTFKPYTTATSFKANRAYFEVDKDFAQQSISMTFDDAPTAVEAVQGVQEFKGAKVQKYIKDGKLFIGNYNIAGQKVK